MPKSATSAEATAAPGGNRCVNRPSCISQILVLSRRDARFSLGHVFCALGHEAAYISKKVSPIGRKAEWSGQHQLALVSLEADLLTTEELCCPRHSG